MLTDHSDSETKPTAATSWTPIRNLLCATSYRQDGTNHSQHRPQSDMSQ